MGELEKRFDRGIEKVIKDNEEGLGAIGKKWRYALEKEEDITEIYLTAEEAIHITRKLFRIPTHLKIEEEVKIACKIARKIWQSEMTGDPETMFKGGENGE